VRRVGVVVAGIATAVAVGASAPAPAVADDPPPASVAVVGDSIGRDAELEVTAEVTPTNPIAYYHAIAAGWTGYHLPLLLPSSRPQTVPTSSSPSSARGTRSGVTALPGSRSTCERSSMR
jgi:hypothetical protein